MTPKGVEHEGAKVLIEKEVVGPGTYWYVDQKTGLPRKLVATPERIKHWHTKGNEMLSYGLPVPIPIEHDFDAHPMTPADQLLNNAGQVKEYRIKDAPDGRKNVLFSVCDIVDTRALEKIPTGAIKWTSPWFSSFTDGSGRKWDDVIAHLALTTRPRITQQTPFQNIAAALSIASEGKSSDGYCLSRAGLLSLNKGGRFQPAYPVAFSMYSGISLSEDDMPPKKKEKKDEKKPAEGKKKPPESGGDGSKAPKIGDGDGDESNTEVDDLEIDPEIGGEGGINLEPFSDPSGDVTMDELLADLLGALGIHVEKTNNEDQFKRSIYNAVMQKIHELTNDGKGAAGADTGAITDPNNPGAQQNPLVPQVKQEQQPMYMSLEDIAKLPEPTRGVAMSMYNENAKLREELEKTSKKTAGLEASKLAEAASARMTRVKLLGMRSPKVKADLDAMLSQQGMALSMGDGGVVNDPLSPMLTMLEKGLSDMPAMLTAERSALSVAPHPTDDEMSEEMSDKLADAFARQMGCPPLQKAG